MTLKKISRHRQRKIILRLSVCLVLILAIGSGIWVVLKQIPAYQIHQKVVKSEGEVIEIKSNKDKLSLWDKTVNYINEHQYQLKVVTDDYELVFNQVTNHLNLKLNVSYQEKEDYQGYIVDLSKYSQKDQLSSIVWLNNSKFKDETLNKYNQVDNTWVKDTDNTVSDESVILFGKVFNSTADLPSFMNVVINQTGEITEFEGLQAKSRDELIISIKDGVITASKEGKTFIDIYDQQGVDVIDSVEVYVTEKEYAPAITIEPQDGLTIVDGVLIVNKKYSLPSTYNPGLNPIVSSAFNKMKADASKEGLNIWNQSNFRSYQYQEKLYNEYVARDGKEKADTYSAKPGYSEHQTGLTIDMNTITDAFGDTKEGAWIKDNCHKYGFIVRYPKGKEDITGYKYEPWHIRYLGVELATAVYDSGLTLEEYLNID